MARRLAEAIEAVEETRAVGFVVGLAGPLGAGKTEWVKGLAEGFGIEPDGVVSPTFVIATEHAGSRALVHVDLYRLASAGELDAAGFLDWLAPGQVVAIEWADRFPGALPGDRVEVRIARAADAAEARTIEIDATGALAQRVVTVFDRLLDHEDAALGAAGPLGQEEGAPWR